MSKRAVLSVLLSAALFGCGGEADDGGRAELLGEYALTAMDGQAPPVPSPEAPGVVVHSLTLVLTEDRFELGSTFRMEGDTVQSAPLRAGSWERTAEELRFLPEGGDPARAVVFRYVVKEGGGLDLTDTTGHLWAMARVDARSSLAPPAGAPPECLASSAPLFIDHVVFAVNDLAAAADSFRALGFTIKPGRPHPGGLLNAHVKFRSAQEIELMALVGPPTSDVAEQYRRILAGGPGGAYLALAADLDAVTRHAHEAGLSPVPTASGAFQFLSFPEDSAAMAVFFGPRSQIIDPDSILTHANGATGLAEVWVEGGDALGRLLEAAGAVRCGEAVRGGRRGKRFGLLNGDVVVVAREPGRRPRMLGGALTGTTGGRERFGTI